MTRPDLIRTLIVEDEQRVANAHQTYVSQVPGFEVSAVAMSAQEAARVLRQRPVDLVLLDMNLPDGHGLELLRQLRAARVGVDVIAVTSAHDLDVVRAAMSAGVVGYVLKPFAGDVMRDRLAAYRRYRERLQTGPGASLDQASVDLLLGGPATSDRPALLPKGLSPETLAEVQADLAAAPGSSAGEVAARIGSSRVTARRYLEHLVASDRAHRSTRLGSTGRPEVEYHPGRR